MRKPTPLLQRVPTEQQDIWWIPEWRKSGQDRRHLQYQAKKSYLYLAGSRDPGKIKYSFCAVTSFLWKWKKLSQMVSKVLLTLTSLKNESKRKLFQKTEIVHHQIPSRNELSKYFNKVENDTQRNV